MPASSELQRRPYVRYPLDENSGLRAIARDLYSRPSSIRNAGFGVFFLAFGLIFAILFGASSSLSLQLLFAAFVVAGAVLLLSPIARAITITRLLRTGVRARAEVLELRDIDDSTVTLDALTHGWAEGRRRVLLDGEQFDDWFATDAPWSRALRPGVEMVVVVDPRKRRVVLELGLPP